VTQVINMRTAPVGWETNPQFAYIGRPGKGWTAEAAPFGKPKVFDNKPDWPARYRAYLNRELQTNKAFALRVRALKGKTLICFCKPKPCHGDTLMAAVEWLWTPEGKRWFQTRFPQPIPTALTVFEDVEDPEYWADQPERS
jgi:Domain of unknown function (DUF4326)